jgi:hypothetical protein
MGSPENLGRRMKLLLSLDQLVDEDLSTTGDAGIEGIAEMEEAKRHN